MEDKIKIIHNNEQQKDYRVLWTQDKFREMESTLNGYWSKDIWSGAENPLKDKDRTSLTLIFCNHLHIVKTELKFVLYTKMKNYEWTWGIVHVNNVVKNVIIFLGDNKIIVEDKSII